MTVSHFLNTSGAGLDIQAQLQAQLIEQFQAAFDAANMVPQASHCSDSNCSEDDDADLDAPNIQELLEQLADAFEHNQSQRGADHDTRCGGGSGAQEPASTCSKESASTEGLDGTPMEQLIELLQQILSQAGGTLSTAQGSYS